MTDPPRRPDADGPADIVDVAARLRLATSRLARQLRQQAGTGLSPSQFSVLASIEARVTLTLGELASIEQVAPPTITKIVSKLDDDGLVARTVDQRDRRVARVSITEAGHRRLEHSRSRRDAWLAQRLDELGDDDVARLADALAVLERLACPPAEAAADAGPEGAAASGPAGAAPATDGGDDNRPASPTVRS